jgi:hypothetical protein
LAEVAKGVYMANITVGEQPQQHGHWLDRLPAIDRDVAAVADRLAAVKASEPDKRVASAIRAVLSYAPRANPACRHMPPRSFVPAQPLDLELSVAVPDAFVRLYYRHVTQAERYNVVEMEARHQRFRATIPGGYTDSAYPLAYYFEVRPRAREPFLFPGFAEALTNQPYFVLRRA